MKRTAAQILDIYREYLNGKSQEELDIKYHTDTHYHFKKHNLITRTTGESLQLRRLNKIELKYNFESISNPTEAYIVGLMMADGYVGNSQIGLRLKKEDGYLVNAIRKYFSDSIILGEDTNSKYFVISSINACNNAVNIGILKNKSNREIRVPLMNSNLHKDFIRGYFDGDGSIFICNNKFLKGNICSPTIEILRDIQSILIKNGIFSTINKENRVGKKLKIPTGTCIATKDMYRLYIRKKESLKKFYYFIYEDADLFLNRKRKKFEDNFEMLKLLKHVNTEVTTETV